MALIFFSQKENCLKGTGSKRGQVSFFCVSIFWGELLKNPHIMLSMFVSKSLPRNQNDHCHVLIEFDVD